MRFAAAMVAACLLSGIAAAQTTNPCSATIRMVVGDNQDGYLRHRLVTSMAVPIAGCKGREVDCRLSLCSDNQASGWLFG